MAARGSESKEKIIETILSTFEGAFKYDKEIRIPMIEGGEEVQIKVTLTAAKVNVEHGADTALPGSVKATTSISKSNGVSAAAVIPTEITEPTAEEKENLAKLVASLF